MIGIFKQSLKMEQSIKQNMKKLSNTRTNIRTNIRTYQSGFTLIEIMVVVIIIGVMSVAVASSLTGNNDREARLQANRFISVVNEVRDEAIIAGDNFYLIVDDKAGNYHFESIRSQESSAGDRLLRNRSVTEKVELDWDVFEVTSL